MQSFPLVLLHSHTLVEKYKLLTLEEKCNFYARKRNGKAYKDNTKHRRMLSQWKEMAKLIKKYNLLLLSHVTTVVFLVSISDKFYEWVKQYTISWLLLSHVAAVVFIVICKSKTIHNTDALWVTIVSISHKLFEWVKHTNVISWLLLSHVGFTLLFVLALLCFLSWLYLLLTTLKHNETVKRFSV